jgi:DNA polymerase-3 subunit delta'
MLNFKSVVGHEQIIEHMSAALKNKKVSHAYIFEGPNGSGKNLLAKVFATALECEAGYGDACGMCRSCHQMDTGNQPDVRWITHEKTSAISVDDVRTQINADMAIKPYSSRYKIYIVDEAEKLNEQAQNALLKTIEEPPEYGIIMLLTNNMEALLPTILSRCISFHLKPVDNYKIVDFLEKEYGVPDYQAHICAAFSQGVVGRAVDMAVSESFNDLQYHVLNIVKNIHDMDIYEVIETVRHLNNYKTNINDVIDMMMVWYRDALILKVTTDANLIVYKDEYRFLMEQAERSSYEGLNNIIQALEKAKTRLAANVNFDIALEMMLLSMKEN